MKKIFILLFTLACIYVANAQSNSVLSFKNSSENVSKSREKDNIYVFPIINNLSKNEETKKYVFKIVIDTALSTLPVTDYSMDKLTANIDDLEKGYHFYVIIKKETDTVPDRPRKLFLKLKVFEDGNEVIIPNNDSAHLKLQINVSPVRNEALKSYSYLAYVGTNFDLVEGVKAKNLFFATSIFSAPDLIKGTRIGFNLLLYGNRAITSTVVSDSREEFTNRVVGRGDSAIFYTESGIRSVSRVTDNLGASFNLLLRMGNLSDPANTTQFYYAPQIEFIWRRTLLTTEYTDVIPVDSNVRYDRPINGTIILTPYKTSTPINIYDVYLGLAALNMRHENENISVRLQAAFGRNFSYSNYGNSARGEINDSFQRTTNWFMSARAWITEPSSGITFGAEVSNIMFKDYRPYYNVTLSKAFNLKKLSGIFDPVTTR